jgi:hypothetical protein
MFLHKCDTRCDESAGFPKEFEHIVRRLHFSAHDNVFPPSSAFLVMQSGEQLRIPYRVYYDKDWLRQGLFNSTERNERIILTCLGTRHSDGHFRQEALEQLVGYEEAWITPYIIQLASEYVVEITAIVASNLKKRNAFTLAAFVRENADYLSTFETRVANYWSYAYRHVYPEKRLYPGFEVLELLRSLKS